jgi:hypothetical protein
MPIKLPFELGKDARMSRLLDRRSALKMGLLTYGGGSSLAICRAKHRPAVEKQGGGQTVVYGILRKDLQPGVDELVAPDMVLRYSLHRPRPGHKEMKVSCTVFRDAFPDLNFWGTAPLLADGDRVIGQWEGGGTHTGAAFNDLLAGCCRQDPVGRHISQASPYCGLIAAGSSKRSDSIMG